MARKRGGLRTSVYQGVDHWSILFRNGQYRDLGVTLPILAELFQSPFVCARTN